jgi:hypothetical protein
MRRWLISIAIAVLLVQVAGLAIWFMKPETPAFLEKARQVRRGMTLEEANAIMGTEAEVFESTDNEFARCMWSGPNVMLSASLDGDMRLTTASFCDLDRHGPQEIGSLFDETLFERLSYDFGIRGGAGGTP